MMADHKLAFSLGVQLAITWQELLGTAFQMLHHDIKR
jgi:hypothetical protein